MDAYGEQGSLQGGTLPGPGCFSRHTLCSPRLAGTSAMAVPVRMLLCAFGASQL